jgi:hypothetical protein
MAIRLTQSAREALTTGGTSNVLLTSVAEEVVVTGGTSNVLLTSVAVEVLIQLKNLQLTGIASAEAFGVTAMGYGPTHFTFTGISFTQALSAPTKVVVTPMQYVASRRSKVLRVHWPTQPGSPSIIGVVPINNGIATASVQYDFSGDQRNIYGFELRLADNYTVIMQKPIASFADLYVDLANATPLPYLIAAGTYTTLIAYFFNQAWCYSAPTTLNVIVPSTNVSASVVSDSATFGIGTHGAPVLIGNGLTPNYICMTAGGTIITASANCTTWGNDSTSHLLIGVDLSTDGVTWTDIFLSDPATPHDHPIDIPPSITAVISQSPNAFPKVKPVIAVNNMLRVNLLPGSNQTCQNIAVSVGWTKV